MSLLLQDGSAVLLSSKRLAVVVGVNGQSTPIRVALKYAVKDGQDIAETLLSEGCSFELFCPPLLGDQATTAQVKDAVLDFVEHLHEEDFALFYFSGHAEAIIGEAGLDDVYLVTDDFKESRLKHDKDAGLSLRWLRKVLFEHEKAHTILIILDCCFAGKFQDSAPDHYLDELKQRLQYYFAEPGAQSSSHRGGIRLTLTATGDGKAQEFAGHGLLTKHILSALNDPSEQVLNEKGDVTFTRLFGYLKNVMPINQQPRFFGAGDDLILASYPDLSRQKRKAQEQETRRVEREQRLRSMIADHSGTLQNRLESFVGREQELSDLHHIIDTLLSTGGYLTITGQAGQGKSSMIAKLVEQAGKEQQDLERVAFHFIPLTSPSDYQIALLRNLMARLALKYNLSDLYLASESRAALSEGFPRVLKEIAERGGKEIIFVDGLDQLQMDQQTGTRDLSFLPQGPGNPPQGIVFVLGTRPNDTLRPLELLKPQQEYRLPNLRRDDFDYILRHRAVVHLEHMLIDRIYRALNENALYLDMVAKELAVRKDMTSQEVEEIVQQLTDNPENLFSLTIGRLQEQSTLWGTIIKPILGLLLVTNEPLTREELKHLLRLSSNRKIDGEQLNRGLERLGDFVIVDEQQRYSLFHLKFQDYLHQDQEHKKKHYIFDAEDEAELHKYFVQWCEQNDLMNIWKESPGHTLEQQRRAYARHHYITHLYHAQDWEKLFTVLDEGSYGKAKIQYDPSMRSYMLDLALGQVAATSERWNLEETIFHLPHLWRYTLLRCSLASQADKYSQEAFELMLILKQETKALGLAELLTDIIYKSQVFMLIASHLVNQPERRSEALQIFERAEQMMSSFPNKQEREKNEGLEKLARVVGAAGLWLKANHIILSITGLVSKARTLIEWGTTLRQAGEWKEAKWFWKKVERIIYSLPNTEQTTDNIVYLSKTLAEAGLWQDAERVLLSIHEEASDQKVEALMYLSKTLAEAGLWLEAEQLLRSLPDDHFGKKAGGLVSLAQSLTDAGLPLEAEQLLRSLPDDPYGMKADSLVRLAQSLTDVGLSLEAEQLLRVLPNNTYKKKAGSLISIATALTNAGLWLEAKRCWQEAEQLLRSLPDDPYRMKAGALVRLAQSLTDAGLWQDAEQLLRSLPDNTYEKADTLVRLAQSLANTSLLLEAEQLLRSLPDNTYEQRVGSLVSLAKAFANAGLSLEAKRCWLEAAQILRSLPGYSYRKKTNALVSLAKALADAGLSQEAKRCWLEAEQLLRSLPDDPYGMKADDFIRLAQSLTDAGLWLEAEQLLRSLPDDSHEQKADALVRLAQSLTDAGLWLEAEQLLRSLPDDSYEQKANALISLAQSLADAGLWLEAEQLLRSLSSHEINYTQGIHFLVTKLIQNDQYTLAVRIIQKVWLQTTNREQALKLFIIALELIAPYPVLGVQLYESFYWIDTFIQE